MNGIPLNLIHVYVGIPLFAYLAIHGLFFSKNRSNVATQYITVGAVFFLLAALSYGLPVLFTHDSPTLTLTTILGDTLQYASLLCVWLLAAQLLLSRWKAPHVLANVAAWLLTAMSVAVSIRENLASPAHVTITDSSLHLELVSSPSYNFWNALMFMSLLVVGISFLLQVSQAEMKSQKYRIAALGTLFVINGILFAAVPLFGLDVASVPVTSSVAASLVIMAVLIILSFNAKRREPKV